MKRLVSLQTVWKGHLYQQRQETENGWHRLLMPAFFRNNLCVSLISARGQNGPCPMQLVVLIAVKNAVSAATITFTASSIIRCFFIISL